MAIALIEASRKGLFKSKYWLSNLLAGSIVGVVALPLAMAFAIASGVKPEEGLYTAIIAALIVAVFGGTRTQIAGPTGAFVVILASITAQFGVQGLQIATLLAGCILVVMGLLKLGSIIKFIPDPVIVGFTAGIGFIIFVGEWRDFFGLTVNIPLDASFYQKITALITAFPSLNLTTTGLAFLSLLIVVITPKILKRVPGPLVAMFVVTGIQAVFQFNDVATIGSTFGSLPKGLPAFHLPRTTLSESLVLIGPAFTIALLGAIESLLSATAADGMMGTRHNSNQELIGQGLANIVVPFFGGFAATGAIARTATNIRNGGNSPLSAIVHSFILLLVIVFLAPSAAFIPLCSLAAILFVVAYNMSDLHHFFHMIKSAPGYDIFVLVTTFLLTIFTNLVLAVNIGVILAMLFFIRSMIQTVNVKQEATEILPKEFNVNPQDTIVYTIQGPFFFGVAEKIEHALATTHTDPKNIIFGLKNIPFMDITGLKTFDELIEQFHKRKVRVYICEANVRVREKLKKVGILRWVENQRVYDDIDEIFKHINN